MDIEKAQILDLELIYNITTKCGNHLADNGIFQWNENYPSKEILKNDIELEQIWKLIVKNRIIGIVVLTEIEDKEYKNVNWLTPSYKNLYVHRFAIHPNYQNKGYARKFMDFAEEYAIENFFNSIRLDTFSRNKRNQQFYEKRNYVKLESIYFPNQSEFPFYCYEKVLNV